VNLSGTDLSEADLTSADLSRALTNLGGRVHDALRPLRLTSPGGSGRRGANLSERTFSWANLRVLRAPPPFVLGADASTWGKCNAGPASLQAAMSANRAPRLFNIRTKFARTFGQPAGSVGGPESPDFLGDRGSGLGTNDGNHHKPSLIMAETNAGLLRVQRS
jgi:Pentapeptide repeats (8 copies)